MSIKILLRLTFILSILLPTLVNGQISQGGIPIEIKKLKSISSENDLVVMPDIDNTILQKKSDLISSDQLKPFVFAHTFPVSLTLKNSGKWYNTPEVNVWQLYIRSTNAYSINLIFEHFQLPDKARLFLISVNSGKIKGAYTSENNSKSHILAIEPIEGDELLVQYEEPLDVAFSGEFQITKVNHDFIGITASDHRPLGVSGYCNININCDVANGKEDMRDAICRIIIEGREICSGTMMNNTSLDKIPYVLTAYHCINNEIQAQSSIFLFNYEAPYCSSKNTPAIDGDVSHSLSGSSLKASFDSLDFALVQLNNIPPSNYRTYLAGWNRTNTAPKSSFSIHHPKGDIKKVSIDKDAGVTASFTSTYLSNGFWKVLKWDNGVTEAGSSGGGLFDQNNRLVGTLTGGSATCNSPVNDYFSKMALSWQYRNETNKQLKYWLDPLNSNVTSVDGIFSGSGKTLCKPFTNLKETDSHAIVLINSSLNKKGYWSGTNSEGYTDFAEKISGSKNCEVQGISFGIGKLVISPSSDNPFITIQLFSGNEKPEKLLYSQAYPIKNLYNDAMNYFAFQSPVKTVGNFFVSFNISKLNPKDTLVVYMADRKSDKTNSFFVKNQVEWKEFTAKNLNGNGSALLTEIIGCNIDDPLDAEDINADFQEFKCFPNPLSGNQLLNIQTIEPIECIESISVYDLLGKRQNIPITQTGSNSLSLNFVSKQPGIYILYFQVGGRTITKKIGYTH